MARKKQSRATTGSHTALSKEKKVLTNKSNYKPYMPYRQTGLLTSRQKPALSDETYYAATKPAKQSKSFRQETYVTSRGKRLVQATVRTTVDEALEDALRLKLELFLSSKIRQYFIYENGKIIARTVASKDSTPEKQLRKLARLYGLKADTQIMLSVIYFERAKKPTVKKPATKKPTVKKPATKKPTVKKSAAKKPTVKKSAVKKPTVKKPTVKKPAVKKSAVKKPAVKKSAVKKPAVKKLAAKKPATKKPAAKKPTVKKPVAKKPAVKKPAVKKPVAKKPAVKKLTTKKGK